MEALAMRESRDFDAVTIKSETEEARDNVLFDDLDDLPLAARRELLLATEPRSGAICFESGVCEEERSENTVPPGFDVSVKTEDAHCDSEKLLPWSSHTQSSTLAGLCRPDVLSAKPEGEIPNTVWSDELDHIPLCTRRKMLLEMRAYSYREQPETRIIASECKEKPMPCTDVAVKKEDEFFDTEGSSGGVIEDYSLFCVGNEAMEQGEGIHSVARENLLTGMPLYVIPERNAPDHCTESGKPQSDIKAPESDQLCPSERSTKPHSSQVRDVMPKRTVVHSLPCVKVKVEPSDNSNLPNFGREAVRNAFNMLIVKSELQINDEINGDTIDHALLQDRLNLMKTGDGSDVNLLKNSDCSERATPCLERATPTISESVKPISMKRPRKRKRTATDSVETAMEEDAPGLLQVLLDKGITVDEIKLYGESEKDDPLDESFSEDSFADLEDVISKLFSQRPSLLKFAPIRCTKVAKATYCLACLFSLVEQTRYLQFRKWPVEWGWCRDLQSFIFVFERHRRIVLERPEYGYATYFFELLDSLPVHWQVKRLVIAMKLASCSRVTLMENKALSVGEDLSEGEARVLMEYGWIPNTGLGTMLNYCDRVVHDRKNSEDSSEWRSKIGKLLMDGYNGGSAMTIGTVTAYKNTEISEIKQELFY